MTARPIVTDPDTGIPDLIRRLTDDSKRLVTDEVQLAKLEAKESLHRAARGGIWLGGRASASSIIALVALTVFVATLIGRMANDHMWIGALITGCHRAGGGILDAEARHLDVRQAVVHPRGDARRAPDTTHWASAPKRG